VLNERFSYMSTQQYRLHKDGVIIQTV